MKTLIVSFCTTMFLATSVFDLVANDGVIEWVEYEKIDRRAITKDELHEKYPNITVQGTKLSWDVKDNCYNFHKSRVRALFFQLPGSKAKLALTERSKEGKTIAVYNPILNDWIKVNQSCVLVGKLAEYQKNQYSLTIIGFGEFLVNNPESSDDIIDLSDLNMFAGKSVITESTYVGDGTIRIDSIKIPEMLR